MSTSPAVCDCKATEEKLLYKFTKRLIDIVFSLLGLILLMPLLVVVIVVLKLTGERQVFYLQERIGINNKGFNIYKFVTMRKNSEVKGSITYKGDPRVLPFGKFLRKTKINELPQLFNVLKGDISMVGPRPLMDESFAMYPESVQALIYKNNKPGVTGMGSLFFRNEEDILSNHGQNVKKVYRDRIMPVKGDIELWYRENKNLRLDFKIIVFTSLSIVSPLRKYHVTAFKGLNKKVVQKYLELVV